MGHLADGEVWKQMVVKRFSLWCQANGETLRRKKKKKKALQREPEAFFSPFNKCLWISNSIQPRHHGRQLT